MGKKTLYFGRFISTPTPTDLLIRQGAVLVGGDDGQGVIIDVTWDVESIGEALSILSGPGSVDGVVIASNNGFFFPGFVGMMVFYTCFSSRCSIVSPSHVHCASQTRSDSQLPEWKRFLELSRSTFADP